MKPTAQKAINILSTLQEKAGNLSVAPWISPNAVLTLSDARGYCDGVFYNVGSWTTDDSLKEINTSLEILKSIVDVYSVESGSSENPNGDTYSSYDLIMRDGLRYAFSQTELIGKEKEALVDQDLDYSTLLGELCTLLKSQKHFEGLSRQSLNDYAFGILLGYPDEAILSSAKFWDVRDDPFIEPIIHADIRGGEYYRCPAPIYMYPRSLASNPSIQQHEKLWSKILKDFYTSDFHQQLSKDDSFQQRLKDLGYTP